jgi:ribonuclease R
VELPNTVEGLVRVSEMKDDYYMYDEEHYAMIGEHTRKTYKLGEKVLVEVMSADKLLRTTEFAFVDVMPE